MEILKRLVREEEGQGMVEYGLIIALVAIAVITALTAVGEEVGTVFDDIVKGLKGD
ncbi:Flp pilus assembly protein, pilin Flp [Candidatus Syntrophocurvum alkaliphilum]|uniref:Flp pilus assembly protein, pilin Flp n=1 Tax=Candidatus Syntrophocurvum alkaliphilum TaxID=2293317 RepID=A0A6I6DLM5_9FIRM|nr:Flp family type IVb pilin [Candidatus Syntrophocurvum alkaliphilum]QGU00287.1 Flp pilus assembly protein, pilin Flp [Candidatus Syntrophocurvum alkaliphilum]